MEKDMKVGRLFDILSEKPFHEDMEVLVWVETAEGVWVLRKVESVDAINQREATISLVNEE